MQQFLLRRIGLALLALFALTVIAFATERPVDDVLSIGTSDLYSKSWRADRPIVLQYADYVTELVRGDWGESWKFEEQSTTVILDTIPASLRLASLALAASVTLGIALGILAAAKKGAIFDRWSHGVTLFGQSMPIFWLGVVFTGAYAFLVGSVPSSEEGSAFPIFLPAIVLALLPTALIVKLTRSAMLSALDSDYVKLAHIKGLTEWRILWKHCSRNVAVSPLFGFGLIGGAFLTGLVLTESVFGWPGIGLLLTDTINRRDYYVLHGLVLVFGGGFILLHLLFDILRAILDPRIRHTERTHIQYQV